MFRSSAGRAARPGWSLGGILFQAASVLDGVDGEMARATFRTSPPGRDAGQRGRHRHQPAVRLGDHRAPRAARRRLDRLDRRLGGRSCRCSAALLIAWRSRARRAARSASTCSRRSGAASAGLADLVYWAVQTLTGRDCFAFLFMVLIIAGLERIALSIFAGRRRDLVPLCAASRLLPRARARFAAQHRFLTSPGIVTSV